MCTALLLTLSAAPVRAQEEAAREAIARIKTETVRLSVGGGFSVVVGPDLRVDDEQVPQERPSSTGIPSFVLRADLPLSELVLVGVQSSVLFWLTEHDYNFGTRLHYLYDFSALLRLRVAGGGFDQSELTISIPAGPTLDVHHAGMRNYGARLHNEVGWHTGLFITFQLAPADGWLGCFGEAGYTYHYVPKTLEHETGSEDLLYQPSELFLRGGFMLLLFR